MLVALPAIFLLKTRVDAGKSGAGSTLYAGGMFPAAADFFLLRSRLSRVWVNEILRRIFISFLLASEQIAAILFRPVLGPTHP
ncbi:MAG: hypothetical protein H7274_07075 [Rhodoferax sp.]|nr:hypothetical protein [Rhodoferax sp.]